MSIDLRSYTLAAIDLARAAGAVLRRCYGEETKIFHKGAIDLVTSADKEAELLIIDAIARRFPGHDVLAEESGAHLAGGEWRWVVDPLDGTVNFAHRIPHFAVLLALQQRTGEHEFSTMCAVSYDPMRDELFVAQRGHGVSLNGKAARVSPCSQLINAVVATGFSYERLFQTRDNHAEFCRLNLLTQGVRRMGSAGLDLAYVACGRYDAYWEYELKPWDMAGGLLMVAEAGGALNSLTMPGEDLAFSFGDGSVIVSNGVLHPALLAALHSTQGLPVNSRQGLQSHLPSDIAALISG